MRMLHQLNINKLTAVLTRLFFGWGLKKRFFNFLLFLVLSIFSLSKGFSQTRAETVPTYTHIAKKDLPTVRVQLIPPSVNTEEITIAIATDPEGNIYTLSFGNGVDKRDANGNLLDGNFINGLKNPLDIAIDEDGLIYIADYEASGSTFADNGQVKIYDPQGNYLTAVWTSFYRPLGIDVDGDNIYIAEYNDGQQGPEPNPMSRIEVIDKITKQVKATSKNISIPLRIAVNSKNEIFISQAGNNDPAVVILDESLNIIGRLPNITSPGSVVVDAFDYVHVIEYSNRVDFSDFINFESLRINDVQSIAKAIDRGVEAKAFGIKIFSPDNFYRDFFKNQIDFPVDLTFNNCDRMYVNNAYMFGNDTWLGYVPDKLEFDLEIYERTTSADVTPPVAQCIGDFTIDLTAGEVKTYEAADFDDGSYDQCGVFSLAIDKKSFSEADEGDNTVTLTVTDEQGISSSCELVVHVNVEATTDTEAPVFSCPGDMEFSNDSGECGAEVTFLTPKATDNSGAEPTVVQTDGSASGSFFPLGPTKVTYTATDASGNSSECSFTITVVDDEKPENVTCPPNLSYEVSYGETGKIVDFEQPKAFDYCSEVEINQTGGLPSGSEFPLGPTTNTFILSDATGNSITCEFTVTITELSDIEKPVINCPTAIVVSADPGACGAEVEYEIPTATDNSGNAEVRKTAGPESGVLFDVGDTFVHFEAKDEAGNSATCMLKVTVVDDQDPVANCASNFTVYLDDNGTASITAEDLDNGSTDNCEIVSKTLSQYNFTSADVGVVPVTLTVADASGLKDQCTVQITVEDTPAPEGPEAVCKDISVELDELGTATITAAQVYGGTDNSLELDLDVSSFDCSNLGENQVVLTVTNPATGLSDDCTATVTIVDNTAPVANCASNFTVYLDDNGTASITAEDLDNGSRDNCEIVSKTLSQYNFTSADVGVVPVTLTVADASGLTDQCTVQITVEDTPAPEGPEAVCKDISIELDELGTASITAAQVYGGTDNSLELDLDVSSFDCSNLGENQVVLTVTNPATGLSDDCTATVIVKDNTPPEISCTPLTVYLNSEGTVIISAEAVGGDSRDNCRIKEMFLDRRTFTSADIGEQDVKLTVIDNSGNEATCETTVTIKPYEQPPSGGICPDSKTIALDENGEVNLHVKWEGSAELEFELSRSYFTCDDIGVHLITLNYTGDYNGTCYSEITIVDQTPPEIVCLQNLDLRLNASGTASLSAEDAVQAAYDNCEIQSMTLDKTNFTTADIGQQQLMLRVIDESGNESRCRVTVNVLPFEEEEAPVKCTESIVVELDQNGMGTLNPHQLYSGGTGSIQFTLSKEKFSCDDLGQQKITFTYTTPGESGSCEILVEVKDPLGACVALPPVEPPEDDIFLILYPNPSHGRVEVIASGDILLERAEVFDMRGRFLFSQEFILPENAKKVYDLDLRELQSGVYNIKFISGDEEYIRRAIISDN